jgi:hypothetical protein
MRWLMLVECVAKVRPGAVEALNLKRRAAANETSGHYRHAGV